MKLAELFNNIKFKCTVRITVPDSVDKYIKKNIILDNSFYSNIYNSNKEKINGCLYIDKKVSGNSKSNIVLYEHPDDLTTFLYNSSLRPLLDYDITDIDHTCDGLHDFKGLCLELEEKCNE